MAEAKAVSAPTKPPKQPKSRKSFMSLERKKSLFGYVFVSPIIIGLLVIYIPALIQSIQFSFLDAVKKDGDAEFVGWQNYDRALNEEKDFLKTVYSSTVALLPQIFVILIFAFFMANILNQNFHGRAIARVIFFIPVVMSTGIVTFFDNQATSLTDTYSSGEKLNVGTETSAFNFEEIEAMLLSSLGNSGLSGIITSAISSLYTVITSSGVQMLIFLSGLQSISINMYEAAKVEGATGWEVFWKISFPMISPLILVNLLYTVIDLFTSVDNKTIMYIGEYYADQAKYPIASAFSWMYTLLLLAFVGVVFLLVKKLIVYQD